MTPEETINQAVWWVLQEVKKEEIATSHTERVYFEIRNSGDKDIPKAEDQHRAVKILENEGVFKNVQNKNLLNFPDMGADIYGWKPVGYYLQILQPKFDDIYKKYEKIIIPVSNEKTSKLQISLVSEKGIGYLKFYKQGPKIKIGGIKTRNFRLLNALIDPPGTAKTIETVFGAIELPKDKLDSRLTDSYLSQERKLELIEYTMKELQKNEGLKGKIKLDYVNNKRSVRLLLEP